MHLLRVQIPEFRVLRNVDIEFEKEFKPKIFPLGSENGGGKSTLLQLIFVLLHCSKVSDRQPFLTNMLKSFRHPPHVSLKTLAKFDIWDGEKVVKIEFLLCSDLFRQFEAENLLPITSYISENNEGNNEELSFLCRIEGLDTEATKSFLSELSEKIFLAAPSTQVYLFLAPDSKKLLFKEKQALVEYQNSLDKAKSALPGFSAYDFFSVDSIIEFFRLARDKDFEQAVETGKYGNHYKTLWNDINLLLTSKTLSPAPDLSGIIFKVDKAGESIELYPEDLSHGELKRLVIYAWLKAKNIEDAIVLIDEIETALHPDWQYQIVSDLESWSPTNQYILATHSFELCNAVTPAHVKELEPTLIKPGHN